MRDDKELIAIADKLSGMMASYDLTNIEVMTVFKLLETAVNKSLYEQSGLHYEIPMETTK